MRVHPTRGQGQTLDLAQGTSPTTSKAARVLVRRPLLGTQAFPRLRIHLGALRGNRPNRARDD